MLGVVVVYLGLIAAFLGGVSLLRPPSFLAIRTRRQAALVLALGFIVVVMGGSLPAREVRVATPRTQLDQFAPVYQFSEFHYIRIAAPKVRHEKGDNNNYSYRKGKYCPQEVKPAMRRVSAVATAGRERASAASGRMKRTFMDVLRCSFRTRPTPAERAKAALSDFAALRRPPSPLDEAREERLHRRAVHSKR